MSLLCEITANHTARSVDVSSGSYRLLNDGTSLGVSVVEPMFGRTFMGEQTIVTGARRGDREQQLRVLVTSSTLALLQTAIDDLYLLAEDVSKQGGYLRFRSANGSTVTRYRVALVKVSAPERFSDYELSSRAIVTLGLVVDPLGTADTATAQTATGSLTWPRTLEIAAPGGTADALASVSYAGSGSIVHAMLLSWWPTVAAHNMVWNGGAEVIGNAATGAGSAYGWSAAAVSGVIAAATSVERVTTGTSVRTGTGGFQVVTPATTDTGASFAIYRRGGFKAGTTYTARCYVRAASGTTNVRVKLGVSGDLGTGTASALSTTFTIRSVTWTPAATSDVAYFAVGVSAATATTFQFDDVEVFEGTSSPSTTIAGYGPGVIPAAAYNTAKASISTDGSYWTAATDSTYLVGTRVRGSGAMSATANLEFPILPHLFTPDDFTQDEVELAVFARVEVASTQTSLAAQISLASDRGTSYGARRYGRPYGSGGKTLTLPSSSTCFRNYFLGTLTVKVDASLPRREWLRVAFANSGSATGNFGVDYLVVVPSRRCARTASGKSASVVPTFIASTAATTKIIDHDGSARILNPDGSYTRDDGVGGEPIRIPRGGATMLVWPTDVLVDLSDASASSSAKTHTADVQVSVTPRTHLLRQ